MGLKSLFTPKPISTSNASGPEYIDLEEYTNDTEMVDTTASTMVRVAEIHKYEELRALANYVYQGNMLLLDFSAIAGDEIILRRVTADLKKLVADINGDIAGLAKTMMIITPTGVKIDRNKQRAGQFTA